MTLPHYHSMQFRSLFFAASSLHCNYTPIVTINMPITKLSFSSLEQFPGHSLQFFTLPSEPISHFHPFSLYNCGSSSVSHASSRFFMATTEGDVDNNQGEDAIDLAKLKILKQKVEFHGLNCNSCLPGQYKCLLCPKCKGGQQMERSLSFHIPQYKDFAMWRCFRLQCSWAGQVFVGKGTTLNGVNQFPKIQSKQLTEENLNLEPLNDDLIAYFAERKISKEILQKNAVMQISGDQNIIAFTYRRSGVLVSCKYRSPDKKFWQVSGLATSVGCSAIRNYAVNLCVESRKIEVVNKLNDMKVKGTEKILYGLDDIKEADDIIIVEGEIDKLSMEEAGFYNCISVPDGAPQKVSTKELPSPEKDTRFQYIWNCKEYLDKASRIILATDGDKPGQVLAEELARRLGKERCWRVDWPKKDEVSCFKDANEVLMNLGSKALRYIIHNAEVYGTKF